MKKTIGVLSFFIVLLCLFIVGCTGGTNQTTPSNPNKPSIPIVSDPSVSQGTKPSEVIQCQYLPETLDNPNNLPIVKWVCLTDYTPQYQLDETMAQQFNQLLAQKELPFRVQFVVYTSENLSDNWFVHPEIQEDLASAELIYGSISRDNGLSFLQPITDAIDDYALQTAVPHEAYWLQATLDGEVYGIRSNAQYLITNGWWVSDQILKSNALTQDNFMKPYWEMDTVFASILENNGDRAFLRYVDDGYIIGNLTQDYVPYALSNIIPNHFQLIGSCYGIDYSGEQPVIVNYLNTDYAKKTQAALLRYREAGYMATSDTAPYWVNFNNVFADFSYAYEGMTYIPTEPVQFSNTDFGGYMVGLSKNAQNKDAALSLLSLIANDSTLRQQLLFGTAEETVGANRFLSFLSPYSSLRNSTTDVFDRPAAEGLTQLETHQQILDRSIIQLPITFDFSSVQQETEAVNEVLKGAFNRFSQLTESEYEKMLSDIKIAGGDKIQNELQRQLDTWLAENPNWNK